MVSDLTRKIFLEPDAINPPRTAPADPGGRGADA